MERIKGIKIKQGSYEDKPIVFPVKCFCCWDGGLVGIPSEIYDQVIEGEQDKPFICQRVSCEAGRKYLTAYNSTDEERKSAKSGLTSQQYQQIFDVRLNSIVCEAIHQYQQDMWVKTIQNAYARMQDQVRQETGEF